ncbi:MAG: riboflavin synthase [Pseudomonadota bacterium]
MFTGIIQALGTITRVTKDQGDLRINIKACDFDFSKVALGDSIAINGVCLTAVELGEDEFAADVSNETLAKTSLANIRIQDQVNLEGAMALGDQIGGHLVSGHVDGLAEVLAIEQDARSWRFSFKVSENLSRFVAAKGSVCLDGVSLTVNGVDGCVFDVNIIPHTMENTVFSRYNVGTKTNFEIDLIARYLERLLSARGDIMSDPLTLSTLREAGFDGEKN